MIVGPVLPQPAQAAAKTKAGKGKKSSKGKGAVARGPWSDPFADGGTEDEARKARLEAARAAKGEEPAAKSPEPAQGAKGEGPAGPLKGQDPAATAQGGATSEPADIVDLAGAAVAETKAQRTGPAKELESMLQEVQKGAPEPTGQPAKAETPTAPPLSRADISRVMTGVQDKARECARKFSSRGMAELKLTVDGSGAVTALDLSGPLAGSPAGSCVEQLVNAARFPQSAGLQFDYRLTVRP